jgi:hypothetical protein
MANKQTLLASVSLKLKYVGFHVPLDYEQFLVHHKHTSTDI